jgi:hypothetical protein
VNLDEWAREVAGRHGITLGDELRRTTADVSDRPRNLMYEAGYEGRPAILKLYDEEVISVEAESLQQFREHNRSRVLGAPELYLHEVVSLTRGWLLIEKLPDDGRFFESPLSEDERERFVNVFVEYRRNFPRAPNRPLALAEMHDAAQFHTFRLMQAVEKASTREQQREFAGERPVLDRDAFVERLDRALERLRRELGGRPLHWGHGHVKSPDVYEYPSGDRWALTDFGHTKMLPDGYEPAFAVWWDRMMDAPPVEYSRWRAEIHDWSARFVQRVDDLSDDIMRASLLERSLATVLEWLALEDDLPADERGARLELHERLIDELS